MHGLVFTVVNAFRCTDCNLAVVLAAGETASSVSARESRPGDAAYTKAIGVVFRNSYRQVILHVGDRGCSGSDYSYIGHIGSTFAGSKLNVAEIIVRATEGNIRYRGSAVSEETDIISGRCIYRTVLYIEILDAVALPVENALEAGAGGKAERHPFLLFEVNVISEFNSSGLLCIAFFAGEYFPCQEISFVHNYGVPVAGLSGLEVQTRVTGHCHRRRFFVQPLMEQKVVVEGHESNGNTVCIGAGENANVIVSSIECGTCRIQGQLGFSFQYFNGRSVSCSNAYLACQGFTAVAL